MKVTRKALETIAKQLHGTSDDVTRISFQYLMIEPINNGNTVQFVTTDGHIMSQSRLDADNFRVTEKLYIMNEYLKPLKQILKDTKKHSEFFEFELISKDNGNYFELIYGTSRIVFDTQVSFPDVNSIIPSEHGYNWEISFNADLLIKLAKSIEHVSHNHIVTLKMKSPKSPIIVTTAVESVNGLLMPCRGPTKWGVEETETKKAV